MNKRAAVLSNPDQAADELLDALFVERLDEYLFRGKTPEPSLPALFGGQVLAQARIT